MKGRERVIIPHITQLISNKFSTNETKITISTMNTYLAYFHLRTQELSIFERDQFFSSDPKSPSHPFLKERMEGIRSTEPIIQFAPEATGWKDPKMETRDVPLLSIGDALNIYIYNLGDEITKVCSIACGGISKYIWSSDGHHILVITCTAILYYEIRELENIFGEVNCDSELIGRWQRNVLPGYIRSLHCPLSPQLYFVGLYDSLEIWRISGTSGQQQVYLSKELSTKISIDTQAPVTQYVGTVIESDICEVWEDKLNLNIKNTGYSPQGAIRISTSPSIGTPKNSHPHPRPSMEDSFDLYQEHSEVDPLTLLLDHNGKRDFSIIEKQIIEPPTHGTQKERHIYMSFDVDRKYILISNFLLKIGYKSKLLLIPLNSIFYNMFASNIGNHTFISLQKLRKLYSKNGEICSIRGSSEVLCMCFSPYQETQDLFLVIYIDWLMCLYQVKTDPENGHIYLRSRFEHRIPRAEEIYWIKPKEVAFISNHGVSCNILKFA